MKNILILIKAIFISKNSDAQVIPRDVLAIPGTFSTSYDWHPQINAMKNFGGYEIREVFSPSLWNWQATIPVNVINSDNMVNAPNHNFSGVLGIGHDVGGLTVRGLMQSNTNVTGALLVGTPNRGSSFFREIIFSDNNGLSNMEKWLNNLEQWKGEIECPDCDKTKALKDLIERIKKEEYAKGAINDPNGYYNTLPAISGPAGIIWGNSGDQTLGDLLGSTGGSTSQSFLDIEGCADRLKSIREASLEQEEFIDKLDMVTSVFSSVISFFKIQVQIKGEDGKPMSIDKILTSVSTFITSITNTIKQTIINSSELADDRKELLLCELANQRLEAEWRLRVIGGNSEVSFEEVINPNYNDALCQQYSFQCEFNTQDPAHSTYCYYADMYCHGTQQIIVTEPTDLIFTKTEQTYPGIEDWEIEANHYQEQQYVQHKVAYDHFFQKSHDELYIPKG